DHAVRLHAGRAGLRIVHRRNHFLLAGPRAHHAGCAADAGSISGDGRGADGVRGPDCRQPRGGSASGAGGSPYQLRLAMNELDPEQVATLDVLSPQSPGAVFWTQMKKSPLAIAGGVILAFFYLLALLAPFVAPYTQEEMDRQRYFHPPQRLHWVHNDGHFSLRPFVRDTTLEDRETFQYREDTSVERPVRLFVHGYDYHLLGLIPSDRHLFGVDAPGRLFIFGTDFFGLHVLSRLLYVA